MMKDLIKIFHNILNCKLELLDGNILSHYFLTKWGKALKGLPYADCLKQYPPTSRIRIWNCLHWLIQACNSSQLRAIKTIRLPAYLGRELASHDPEIRFIYYHRDPRAMSMSRSKFKGFINWQDERAIEAEAVKQCSLSRHDDEGFKNTFTQGQYKPLVVRYEDFAMNPLSFGKVIYQYLGLVLPSSVGVWLDKHTTAKKGNGILGTTRNSSQTAQKWKQLMRPVALEIFNNKCDDVLKSQGYS